MKVAHVTATFPPYRAGTGNVAYHNARLLHERGYDVTVFTADIGENSELPDFPFEVKRLPVAFRVGNAPLTLALVHHLRNFDLIHVHYPYIFGAEFCLFASIMHRIPLVTTYHNQLREDRRLKQMLFRAYNYLVEPVVLRRSNKICAVSIEHFASVHSRLSRQINVFELPNGVDTTSFAPQDKDAARRRLDLPLGVPIALFVGALDQAHRFKNVDGLLRAFARIENSYAILLIVGDGDLRYSLESLSHALGIEKQVRFLGRREPEALPTIYSAADVTVLPSTSVESFGLVLIESMACATPVIATNLPGVSTLIVDREDGYLIPAWDETALASSLAVVLNESATSQEMGRKGHHKIKRYFDWEIVGDKLEQCYDQLTRQVIAA